MGRVGRALIVHEVSERLRDRWVLVVTALFALLSSGIALYGRAAGDAAGVVTAPSLVTLASFLVPLVALVLGHDAIVGERERNTLGLLLSLPVSRGEVLLGKFVGRAIALALATAVGMGTAAALVPAGQRGVLLSLVPSTLLLGLAFLAVGVLISASTRRHATASSLAVATWFLLVLFWDLGILVALVATHGALSQRAVATLVVLDPTGLYRVGLMERLMGPDALEQLGVAVSGPGGWARAALWVAWITVPLGIGGLLLARRQAVTA